ncbi:MAG: type II toxin-antitoxin system VapC family toxin [Bryobacteraceae bacterium]
MILLDTHIWVWWASQPDRLHPAHRELLEAGADRAFGVSIISCWEIAKLVEYGRLKLDRSVGSWIDNALAEPGVSLLHLTPQIVVESTQLPQPFHSDPADQLLVATARVLQCPLMTEDSKITAYAHVRLA